VQKEYTPRSRRSARGPRRRNPGDVPRCARRWAGAEPASSASSATTALGRERQGGHISNPELHLPHGVLAAETRGNGSPSGDYILAQQKPRRWSKLQRRADRVRCRSRAYLALQADRVADAMRPRCGGRASIRAAGGADGCKRLTRFYLACLASSPTRTALRCRGVVLRRRGCPKLYAMSKLDAHHRRAAEICSACKPVATCRRKRNPGTLPSNRRDAALAGPAGAAHG